MLKEDMTKVKAHWVSELGPLIPHPQTHSFYSTMMLSRQAPKEPHSLHTEVLSK